MLGISGSYSYYVFQTHFVKNFVLANFLLELHELLWETVREVEGEIETDPRHVLSSDEVHVSGEECHEGTLDLYLHWMVLSVANSLPVEGQADFSNLTLVHIW